MKNKNKRNPIVSIVGGIAAAAVIIGTVAFLTSYDEVTNVFSAGNLSILLTEPHYEPDNAGNITPYKQIDKDPVIRNNGTNDIYVFLRITVPVSKVTELNEYGTAKDGNTPKLQELFYLKKQSIGINELKTEFNSDNWIELTDVEAGGEYNGDTWEYKEGTTTRTYVFGYKEILKPNEVTATLFDKVQLKNLKEQPVPDTITQVIGVEAFAIQADNLDGTGNEINKDNLTNIYKMIK